MRPALKLTFLFLLSILSADLSATSGDHNKWKRADPMQPIKVEVPPTIDGVLDDPIWQEAPSVTGFKTFRPDYEKDMPHNTTVYMAYDREHLYFAFQCDDDIDKIKTSMTPRDNIRPDDWVCINLDFFNDHQSLYAFYVNPSGIQMDANYSAGQEDIGFDLVWYTAAQINDKGYAVEFKIPFKSIRYSNGRLVEMGVIFERKISRFSMQGTFPAMAAAQGTNFLVQTMPLQYEDIEKYTLLEILPAFTYGKYHQLQSGTLESDGGKADFSLTGKFGITSNLILDATYNPDFSQVEADAGQIDVNNRFALFFAERRPFFLEGSETFNFAGTSHHDPLRSTVNTRSIVNPIAAIKLTGKLSRTSTISSILAVDELTFEDQEGGEFTEKPFVSILRFKQKLKGDSYLGMLYTGRDRDKYYNRVGGLDATIRTTPTSTLAVNYLASFDREDVGGQTTNGSVATVDWTMDSRKWSFTAMAYNITEDFNTDVGFLTRTGFLKLRARVGHKFYPDTEVVKKVTADFFVGPAYDHFSDLWEYSYFLTTDATLLSNTSISMWVDFQTEIFDDRMWIRNAFNIRANSQLTKRLTLSGSFEHGQKVRYVAEPYSGYGKDLSLSAKFQVGDSFQSELSWNFADFFRKSDDAKDFDFSIWRSRNTYQINKYLFLRGIVEYNSFDKSMDVNGLISFTYIPGTVIHLGYGSLFEKVRWDGREYQPGSDFIESRRGLFFKASYLWRL